MQIDNIIKNQEDELNKYIKRINKNLPNEEEILRFNFDITIKKLLKLKESKTVIHKIKKKTYLMDSINRMILSNPKSYLIFLSNIRPNIQDNKTSYIKYNFTKQEGITLFTQLVITEKLNGSILDIEKVDDKNLSEYVKLDLTKTLYLVITQNLDQKINSNDFTIRSPYKSLPYLMGRENLSILKHQRLDRIRNFLKNPTTRPSYELFDSYRKYLESKGRDISELFLVYSGSVYQTLGTTYTPDVDAVYISMDKDVPSIKNTLKEMKDINKEYDISLRANNGYYYKELNQDPKPYMREWFTLRLPELAGANSIYNVLFNSKFHFHFMGIKVGSLKFNYKRVLKRGDAGSIADLLMLKKYNNFDVGPELCIPNLTVRQGYFLAFTQHYINNIHYPNIQKALKEYYNEDMSLNEIKSKIKKCSTQGFEVYTGKVVKDEDTDIIKFNHGLIKTQIFEKYYKNISNLLDIGSGRLADLKYWTKLAIPHVVGIEPSIDAINLGKERKNYDPSKVNIIHGVGEEEWTTDNKYKDVLKHKYDVISFQYTIHYMLTNLNILLSNLDKVSKSGTKVVITCMDGNKIHKNFNKYGKLEIRNKFEPIFAIAADYNFNKPTITMGKDEIIVYFKGAYGVSSGSIEPIVDLNELDKKFSEHKFKHLETKNFASFNTNVKNKLLPIQLEVSSYYILKVYEKQ